MPQDIGAETSSWKEEGFSFPDWCGYVLKALVEESEKDLTTQIYAYTELDSWGLPCGNFNTS